MAEGDAEAVSRLVQNTFYRFIAQDYKPEGMKTFLEETSTEGISCKMREWPLLIVAAGREESEEDAVVGVIALRRETHISLFFVDERWQGRGVGRLLLREAIQRTRETFPEVQSITVNSSPHGVGFYEKMGFQRNGPEQFMEGMLVNPMVLHL